MLTDLRSLLLSVLLHFQRFSRSVRQSEVCSFSSLRHFSSSFLFFRSSPLLILSFLFPSNQTPSHTTYTQRYREKDLLEEDFKAYSRKVPFDMSKVIDTRQRSLYAERYDSRKALQDWDYGFCLKQSASIIHIKQVMVLFICTHARIHVYIHT